MKISDAIEILSKFKNEHGDLPIVNFGDDPLTRKAFNLSDDDGCEPACKGTKATCLVLDF